jgi:spore coat assembly protein SafA
MTYVIQPGDTLFFIAGRFGVTVEDILAANLQITNPDLIFPGQIIEIPVPAPPPPPDPGITYIVQPGDTLFNIARQFGVPLAALIAANPQIADPDLIFPGQIIVIPVTPAPPVPPGFNYVVQPGDTLFFIARRFGVSLDALIAANPQIADPNLIFPGQIILIPVAELPPLPPGAATYIIQPGDTLFNIAQRFGLSLDALIAANPQIADPNLIFPGQIIIIFPLPEV